MGEFDDKVAVITGSGRGIGLAIAKKLAGAGAKVALISRSDTAEKAAATIEGARGYAVDMSDGEAVLTVGKQILEDFGKVSILVNNAGVTRDGLCMRMSEDDWDTVLDTNLKGAFNAVKAFQRSILKEDGARIINISSVIGLMGNAGQANYAASKAGLIGLTKSLAREFAGRKVTVNAIAPGFIVTDMTDGLPDNVKEGVLQNIPLKTFGDADDVAEAALFLASPRAKYITGQVLTVDGGMVMQ